MLELELGSDFSYGRIKIRHLFEIVRVTCVSVCVIKGWIKL